jgi:hypothetical protein
LTPFLEGRAIAGPVLLGDLPALPALQAAPYDQGRALTRALGGDALLAALRVDPDSILLLDTDEPAAAVPWEFAAVDGPQFLACRFALVRLVDLPAAQASAPDTLRFLVLGADPLVDDEGRSRQVRLRIDDELRAIRRTLSESGIDLVACRVPPTRHALRRALRQGPAMLHLTCHGSVIKTENGPLAMLLLEDTDGGPDYLHGPDLAALPPAGVLQLVLLSACHTADPEKGDATLARALVQNGVPAAIGVQGRFPDRDSDDLAVALYEYLLSGHSLAEALCQARLALCDTPAFAGLPVCYAARDGWGPLPLRQGTPVASASLRLPGSVRLPPEVQARRPLHGRNGDLHALAQLYATDTRVVTVVGTGGVGKTALAATFSERFAWRWAEGVLGVSFASGETDAARFHGELLGGLLGKNAAQTLANAPLPEQAHAILQALRDWDGLLLLDNYESVLQGLDERDDEAITVHQLVAQAANGGTNLLLTNRQQPAKLRGEHVFPRADRLLPGLEADPAAALFLEHSARAKDEGDAGHALACEVAQATEGHPLAIALLAKEYDVSPEANAVDFLRDWGQELAQARDYGLSGHHRTFWAAFDRSYGGWRRGSRSGCGR